MGRRQNVVLADDGSAAVRGDHLALVGDRLVQVHLPRPLTRFRQLTADDSVLTS